jgi:hypothetical protein
MAWSANKKNPGVSTGVFDVLMNLLVTAASAAAASAAISVATVYSCRWGFNLDV